MGIPDLASSPIGKALSDRHQFVDLYIDFWDPVDKKLRREARAELSLWLKRNQLALWGLWEPGASVITGNERRAIRSGNGSVPCLEKSCME